MTLINNIDILKHFQYFYSSVANIIHSLAEKYGGSFSAEHGIGRFKKEGLVKFRSAGGIDLMSKSRMPLIRTIYPTQG